MTRRRRARELAVQVLFHMEFNEEEPEEAFRLIAENFAQGRGSQAFAEQLVAGVHGQREALDRMLSEASRNWRLPRMSRLDRCILRLATFEMSFLEDVPPKVSIDEAVEMAKKFGAEGSGSFVNGLLDHIYNRLVRDGRIVGEVPLDLLSG